MHEVIPAPGAFVAGVAIFAIVIWDAFEAIILPRRVTRRFRLTRLFYKTTWQTWRFAICMLPNRKSRDALLGFYGPSSLLVLVGGYFLRRTIIEAGQPSSQDARTTLWHAQRPRSGASR